jgi:NADH:ubiquinone oxidoreductase subunit 2 (subunit N)
VNPVFDYHALAPELILTATIVVVLVADFFFGERERFQTSRLATIGVLAALVPILTLAADGTTRTMFGGAYVVDDYALALKGFWRTSRCSCRSTTSARATTTRASTTSCCSAPCSAWS